MRKRDHQVDTFASLGIRSYRLWAAGSVVSNTGTWMQRVAQDWLVLTVLTDNSGVAVGITTGLQFLPMLVLSPLAGLIADRYSKRRILALTQGFSGVWALVLGLAVINGVVELWHVYALATLLGVTAALDAPARQTFVAEMVPEHRLSNAVSLNSASFHAGRLIGPGAAGLLIVAVGTGPVFLINAASFAATMSALFAIRGAELTPAVLIGRERGQIRAGLAYVRRRSDLVALLFLVGMVGTFALNFQLTTALMATSVYGKGAGEYGLLGSIMAVGSLGGALLAARRGRPSMRLVVMAAAVFGLCCLVASAMPTYPLFALSLVPTGLASLTFMTSANASVQLATERQMRGRVMALYMAIFMGGTPAGAPFIGWVGETFGARWTLAVGGVATLLAVGVVVAAPARRKLAWTYMRQIAGYPLASKRRRLVAADAMAADEMTLR